MAVVKLISVVNYALHPRAEPHGFTALFDKEHTVSDLSLDVCSTAVYHLLNSIANLYIIYVGEDDWIAEQQLANCGGLQRHMLENY